jgi:hypothetical protein
MQVGDLRAGWSAAYMEICMTEEQVGKIPFPRFQNYLMNAVWLSAPDVWASKVVSAVCKWGFDFLRNAMIAGVLRYLADRSESLTLKIIADVAMLLLVAYCTHFVFALHLQPFHPLKNKKLARVLNALFTGLLVACFLWVVIRGIPAGIEAIAQAQTK